MKYTRRNENGELMQILWVKIISHIAIGLFIFIVIILSFGTIGAGERGILLRFGAVQDKVLGEGLYFKIPFAQSVKRIDIKTQKQETQALSYSQDLQTIDAKVALNYHISADKANKLWQEIGEDYADRIINPTIQEVVKAITAQFTAQQLIEERPKVKELMKNMASERLQKSHIIMDDFSIMNFDFSDEYEKAIEAKQVAQQDAIKAERILEKMKIEAEQAIAEAKGKAEAIRIESEALRNNPQVLELRALEKWNGVLPQVTGGAIPFINIK